MSKSFIIKRPVKSPPWDEPTPLKVKPRPVAGTVTARTPSAPVIKNIPVRTDAGSKIISALKQAVAGEVTTHKVLTRPKPPKLVSIQTQHPVSERVKTRINERSVSRYVYEDGKPRKTWLFPVLSVATTSEAIDTSPLTLAKWIKEGMMPAPILKRTDTPVGAFFHRDEVLAIAGLILDHQRTFKYYRKDHLDLRQKLSAALSKIRAERFQ